MFGKRLSVVVFVLFSFVLIFQILGCSNDDGPSPKTLTEIVPASNEISGWEETEGKGPTLGGPDIAYTLADAAATLAFNGAADKLVQVGFVAVAEEYYKKDELLITLDIVELPSVQDATNAYEALEDYGAPDFTDVSFNGGEAEARMGETPNTWRLEANKSKYFLSIDIKPKTVQTIETDAKAFMKAVLQRIP